MTRWSLPSVFYYRVLGCVVAGGFFVLLALCADAAEQDIVVNGLVLKGAQTNLNITIEVIEFRQGNDPVVRLTTGKKRYNLALVSPTPIPLFDAEFPFSNAPPRQFTVSIEDGREFTGCLVAGLKSSGADPSHHLSYALACENVSLPPTPCTACVSGE